MTRVGLDVGLTAGSVIIWTVFADTSRHKGTGTYTGASAEMSIAAGLGANVLLGGSHQTLALQLSVHGKMGLNRGDEGGNRRITCELLRVLAKPPALNITQPAPLEWQFDSIASQPGVVVGIFNKG